MKIAVIGAGNMGMAFSNAFVKRGILSAKDILLVEPRIEAHPGLKDQGFSWLSNSIDNQIENCNIIILAVKPQDFKTMSLELKKHVNERQVILSIMAGISIEGISDALNQKKIVRSMPNTPAKLGVGITGFFSQNLSAEELHTIKKLLESTGSSVELDKESLLNAVTALSGSGPAYFYYFLKSIVEAGEELGLPYDLAQKLACETMNGSYQLIKDSNMSFDELIKAVTSKGGTTEAALGVFDGHNISECIKKGVLRAEERAKELSSNN
ncbi:MAG: pyrroline-5-carboxylate reductase [Opitutaceae bacterium]|nr:pyrroline-5-carboxylate reductase [Cytophagales bacterium]